MNTSIPKVIAAVRDEDDLDTALSSGAQTIFDLSPNILTLEYALTKVHKRGKKLFIHVDLAKGITPDKYGMRYIKELGADGIISTRTPVIKTAREEGLVTVQRFFVVDSHFAETTLDSVKTSKPAMIEVMPGTVYKVISRLSSKLSIPIIAGGLIENADEVRSALSSGARAISTGAAALWDIGNIL